MQRSNPVIIAVTTDLFVQSRLNELAKSLGLSIQFAFNEQEMKNLAVSHPRLVVLDLSATEFDPFVIVRAWKQNELPPRILGYYPHIRKDLETKARDAGVDVVVPNSSFLETLKRILEVELSES